MPVHVPTGPQIGVVASTTPRSPYGKPGVGHGGWTCPTQLSFAELPVSLGIIDRIAPAAATSLNATTTALISGNTTPRRVGVSNQAATWGGMGEAIDTLSGNLNYSFGIGQLKFRNGGGLPLALTYNSQNWRKTNSTVEKLGGDLGFGFWLALTRRGDHARLARSEYPRLLSLH